MQEIGLVQPGSQFSVTADPLQNLTDSANPPT